MEVEGEEYEGDCEEEDRVEEATKWDRIDRRERSEVVCRMLVVAEKTRRLGSMGILKLPVVLYQEHTHDDASTSEEDSNQAQGMLY